MPLLVLWSLLAADLPEPGLRPDSVPLYADLGSHHHVIATSVPKAQQYFDQGLRLVFGFNHGEAIRAFDEAARLDPDCAMCYWGTAYAYGPHVNAPMDSASGVAAYAAVQRALAHLSHASAQERAYIRALAKRYARVPPANRATLDSAYAARYDVARRYPNDLDAATLHAEAMMDLRPGLLEATIGRAVPDSEIVAQLERVIIENPNHPVHATITSTRSSGAARQGGRVRSGWPLMPETGTWHMPAHIYIRYATLTRSRATRTRSTPTRRTSRTSGPRRTARVLPAQPALPRLRTRVRRSGQAIEAARVSQDGSSYQSGCASTVRAVGTHGRDLGRWDEVF
jgi:hypothetical protein